MVGVITVPLFNQSHHQQTRCSSQTFFVYLSRPTPCFSLFEKHNQASQKEEQKPTVLVCFI